MGAFFGFTAFILALFAIGAVVEENLRKAAMFGAAFAVCCVIVMMGTPKLTTSFASTECHTDWDGFSNGDVCD
ncbi:hypothetical protein [Candidatus Phyllobacterium onerii]|uniref:hypothetical protein n=1 Tax=Candidatus Phyllobacterium onerii TaxID=3020828 RepID=UPI00232E62DC|nr:hypothetical protein [Phyllobacterium sp. IY22]